MKSRARTAAATKLAFRIVHMVLDEEKSNCWWSCSFDYVKLGGMAVAVDSMRVQGRPSDGQCITAKSLRQLCCFGND